MASIINQVEQALLALYQPGTPKRQLSSDQRARLILSGRTLEVYLEHGCHWGTWIRAELGVRRLVDARLAGQPWVQHLIDSGRSAWTVAAAISALRKLESGIEARWGRPVVLIAPEALVGRPRRRLRDRQRRGPYQTYELWLIRRHLDPAYLGAVEAMLALGCRRHEVISVRACDVDLNASTFAVRGSGGGWRDISMPPGYAGVVLVRRGKGGRPREIPIPQWYRQELESRVGAVAMPEDRLWPVQARQLHRAVWEACQAASIPSRGVHGLRHTWAQTTHAWLTALAWDDRDARQVVSWWLGHNRLAVTSSYIPKRRQLT